MLFAMTPTHTDSPLRRSELGVFRAPAPPPIINDDEEERRQARRRTAFNESIGSSTIEDNETLKDCLKIYSENKLSKENAWSVSLIDTLSALLDKHHKSLNNFKVAGSSLEASSKVYGLRVDSIHTDVVRMSAGLGKQKILDENIDTTNIVNEAGINDVNEKDNDSEKLQKKKQKRVRKQVSTITKNKETINGRLDTNPFTDPIFAKLNSTVGSINCSSRLLNNILSSSNSELRLRMDYPFWDFQQPSNDLIFNNEAIDEYCEMIDFTSFGDLSIDDCVLRPNQTGYIITDKPAEQDDDGNCTKNMNESFDKDKNNSQMGLAFDMNAAVEPIPQDVPLFLDVEMGDVDDFTPEEHIALNKCKGLRRAPVIIEDMRPVDSKSSQLEYSYRPIEKISQYWAGPSHWKFKKSRGKSLYQRFSSVDELTRAKAANQQQRRKAKVLNQVEFGEPHDDLFSKLEEKNKLRQANIQKKWDSKKLKLPTDLQIDYHIFDIYRYAPSLQVLDEVESGVSPDIPIESSYNYNNPVDQEYCSNIPHDDDYTDTDTNVLIPDQVNDEFMNQTVVEIATDFEGAPDKVIKIVVPFAKRAKVVDMKQLKKCCLQVINNRFTETLKENSVKDSKKFPDDKYKPGQASFNKIYETLPNLLSTNMVEALSTSVAFYSILHLANDSNLRLFQQDDLNDFLIRQLDIQ